MDRFRILDRQLAQIQQGAVTRTIIDENIFETQGQLGPQLFHCREVIRQGLFLIITRHNDR